MGEHAFRAEARIGAGSMGQVWRGRHLRSGMPVAIKLIQPERLGAAAASDTVRLEARAVAGLSHPHVVWMLDQGEVDGAMAAQTGAPEGTPYLVMEHLSGGDLAQRHLRPRWEAIERDLEAILAALAHCHARGVIHRDLKPGNVLFGAEGDVRAGLKLTDFGIASTARGAEGSFGTPQYCAPEQHGDGVPHGPWTDVYAVGVLAWRLITGRAPFSRWRGAGVYLAKSDVLLPELQPLCATPARIEGWIRDCLAPAIGSRFQCAPDALHALRSLDRTLVAGTSGRVQRDEEAPTALLTAGSPITPDRPAPPPAPLPLDEEPWEVSVPTAALRDAGLGLWRDRPVPHFAPGPQRAELLAAFQQSATQGRPLAVLVDGARGAGRTRMARWIAEATAERCGVSVWFVPEGVQSARRVLEVSLGTPARALDNLTLRGLAGPAIRRAVQAWIDAPEQTVPAAAAVIRAVARQRPTILVLDEADPDDPLVAELLAGPAVPVLLVMVAPSGPASALQVSPLAPLAPEPLAQLLGEVLPLVPDTIRAVASASSGRPGRALELLHDAWEGGRWTLLERGLHLELETPAVDLPPLAPRLRAMLERTAVGGVRPPLTAACVAWGDLDEGRELLALAAEEGLVQLDDGSVIFAPGVRPALLQTQVDLAPHHHAWAEHLPLSLDRAAHLLAAGALDQGLQEMAAVLEDPATRVGLAVVVAHAERALDHWEASRRRPNGDAWAVVTLWKARGRLSLGDGLPNLRHDLELAQAHRLRALEARLRLLEAEHLGRTDTPTLLRIHALVVDGPRETRAIVERALRQAAGREGDWASWERWLDRCRQTARDSRDPRIQDLLHELEADAAAYEGHWDQAYLSIRRCEDLHPGYTDTRCALFALAAGAMDDAEALAARGVERSAGRGDRGHLPWALLTDCLVQALLGRPARARRRLEDARRLTAEHVGRWGTEGDRFALGTLAVHVAEGRHGKALDTLLRLPIPPNPSPQHHAVLKWVLERAGSTALAGEARLALLKIPQRR